MTNWFWNRIIRTWLTRMHDWADCRIKNGDLDFDDVLYRTRTATAELLAVHFPESSDAGEGS